MLMKVSVVIVVSLATRSEGLIDYHQYYKAAAATIFFYDILLTLADEVNRTPLVSPFAS